MKLGCVSAEDFDEIVNGIPVIPKAFVKSLLLSSYCRCGRDLHELMCT